MKTFEEYIFEELNKHPLWCEIALGMFKGSKKLTKESVSDMIDTFCDVEGRLKKFSDYLTDLYPKEYLAYQPADDDFIKKENREKICNQIADFILGTVLSN